MKLGLGTVQFGLDYGVSNSLGRTPEDEVGRILRLAADNGIRVLDTAAGYGCSEEVLGRSMPAKNEFAIVTKTPPVRPGESSDGYIERIRKAFLDSVEKLGRRSLYAVLTHRADDLLSPYGERLMETLLDWKRQGLVGKVGASVYDSQQIDAILARYPVELVQLPISVLDQRLLASGHLARLKSAGVEVHARSVFLQGLLLMRPDIVPAYFSPIKADLAAYREWVASQGLSPMQAALGFVLGLPELDHVILGVNSTEQLREILACQTAQCDAGALARYALTDPAMLDPSRWRIQQA